MTNDIPDRYENVAAAVKANVYFDGKVVSHTVFFGDGSKKTLGIIFPGKFSFNTGAPERMDITEGSCLVKLAGEEDWRSFSAGSFFLVPGGSSFEISVPGGHAEYVCSFE
ncbi:MAG: pyrimidine/purine nucleoside phosphorylase [Nitrospirota bacterium]